MIGLTIAIIVFNFIAFKINKRLTANQIVHLWLFTIAFQSSFDVYIDLKYHGYWYFTDGADWKGLLVHTVLLPPVNMMFLNWYPFKRGYIRQACYFIFWLIAILLYEMLTLLPPPWGYFHYGWWNLWHSAILNPVLLLILLCFYKWVCKLEDKLLLRKKEK
ncbi:MULTISPECIES: hypothetical protein [Priestia]|jgi:hypothetical protein|uniref:hypothetical protein n=1 Tax=Priestia TaxID=2800373 RepID=UPI00070A43FF|nr:MULTISPECIES: hypothetical protein [Priestia]KRE04225.1 hypothetical protein ASE46_28185 [Bacillus sp. Root239]MBE5102104.1 hypothetical protein [Priestia aryabhattai]MEC1072130.1 hypothetical protein [Priestia megaterium]